MSALLRSWAVEGIGVRRKFATRESIRNRQVAAATAPQTLASIRACRAIASAKAGNSRLVLRLRINLRAGLNELLRFLFHSGLKRLFLRKFLFGGVLANILGNSHGTKMGTAHGAEVCCFRAFGRKSLTKLMPIIFALAGWP